MQFHRLYPIALDSTTPHLVIISFTSVSVINHSSTLNACLITSALVLAPMRSRNKNAFEKRYLRGGNSLRRERLTTLFKGGQPFTYSELSSLIGVDPTSSISNGWFLDECPRSRLGGLAELVCFIL